jgi:hypothetical protein
VVVVGSYALPLRMRTKVRAFEARIDGMSGGRRSPLATHWQTTEAAEAHCGGFICARDFPVTAVTAMWRALHHCCTASDLCLWRLWQ